MGMVSALLGVLKILGLGKEKVGNFFEGVRIW